MFFALLPSVAFAQCSISNNAASGLNYFECNNSGKCVPERGGATTACDCCDIYKESSWCAKGLEDGGLFHSTYASEGDQCDRVPNYSVMSMGWRFVTAEGETPPVTCDDVDTGIDCKDNLRGCKPSKDLSAQVKFALMHPCNHDCSAVNRTIPTYRGNWLGIGCSTCTEDSPCDKTGTSYTDGVQLLFVSFYNTHYDPKCVPESLTDPGECNANADFGHNAHWAYGKARGSTQTYDMLLTRTLEYVLSGDHPSCDTTRGTSNVCNPGGAFKMSPQAGMPMGYQEQETVTVQDHNIITPSPTPFPTTDTPEPTPAPTPKKDDQEETCERYINKVLDHKFKGTGTSCRGGIKDEWPGGKTCKSPYIICLPDEHTPVNPNQTEEPNKGTKGQSNDPDYTIIECAEECAWDQRCMGFELRPKPGMAKGQCILIDDHPMEIIDESTLWPEIGMPTGPDSMEIQSEAHIRAGLPALEDMPDGLCCLPEESSSSEDDDHSYFSLLYAFSFYDAFDDYFYLPTEQDCADEAYADPEKNFYSYSWQLAQCVTCKTCDMALQPVLWKSKRVVKRLELGGSTDSDGISDALCFEKADYCNPYFEADDLNDVMLNCYCPNNRKGTYTKKVKRTIENTKYCGEDPAIDERIKKAQANRMFHLCENWCLFETHNPETESWYWNPWLKCWREQYAGTGMHRSYCNRVIRNPGTIEQEYISRRSNMFCRRDKETHEVIEEITEYPTMQPSTFDSDWVLSNPGDSCDDACNARGRFCDQLLTESLQTGEESAMRSAFSQAAGFECTDVKTGKKGWAFPGFEQGTGTCMMRHDKTEYTGCNWALGEGYQRLCACYDE